MARVILDGMLRQFGAPSTVTLNAATVGELIDRIEGKFPRLRGKFRNELGEMRPFVRVFRNGELLEPGVCTSTELSPRDQIDILHSIAGG
jgi:sulfur-carrier protein